jgi:hypothetical protein
MGNPSLYILRINGKRIDGESVSCTGKQLRELLDQVEPWVGSCEWYILDIQTNNSIDLPTSDAQNRQTLTGEVLRDACARVDQFMPGIFLAVPHNLSQPKLKLDAVTEDEPSSDLGDALLEIRAFDTSYFEIYTPSPELAERLRHLFNVEVEQSL